MPDFPYSVQDIMNELDVSRGRVSQMRKEYKLTEGVHFRYHNPQMIVYSKSGLRMMKQKQSKNLKHRKI